MQRVGRVRRRTGAFQSGLFQDPADPERFTETYFTRTWAEYTRQQTAQPSLTRLFRKPL